MEEILSILAISGSGRVSGMLALAVCLIGHQTLLFAIGRWTVELDGWRAMATSVAGVAGLSIGSVTMPGLLAPLAACLAAFVVMRFVYEMDAWQFGVMTAGWYGFSLGALLLAGMLFSSPADYSEPPPPVDREAVLDVLREKASEEGKTKAEPVVPGEAAGDVEKSDP